MYFLSASLLTFFLSCSNDDDTRSGILSDDVIDKIVNEIVESGPMLADGRPVPLYLEIFSLPSSESGVNSNLIKNKVY